MITADDFVFPTPVGMNRATVKDLHSSRRVPHARGDEPKTKTSRQAAPMCSPRPWG